MKTKKNLNRRDFIGMTVAGSMALITQDGCRNWETNQIAPESKTAAQQKIRVRYDINSLAPAARRNVEHLRKAVAKMKQLSENQPASKMGWIAQAQIHRQYCAGEHNIHGTGLFLPWHRAYLFFFEEICRQILCDLKIADYEDFALPYWDWSASPQIPEAFGKTDWDEDLNTIKPPPEWKMPADFPWRRKKDPMGNLTSDLGTARILTYPSVYGIIGIYKKTYFPGELETGPHTLIHNEIEGNMKNAKTAALDPIFWLHHANIDRIWSKWMETHVNIIPSPLCKSEGCNDSCLYPENITKWLSEKVEGFYDTGGASVNRQVIDLLDTTNLKHLGYCYDDCKPVDWISCPKIQKIDLLENSIESKVIGQNIKINEPKRFEVGNFLESTDKNAAILKNLNASINGMFQFQKSSDSSALSQSLLLCLEVEKPVNPAVAVRIFITATPDPSKLSIESPSYVATFSFFESTDESHQHDESKNMNIESRRFIFDITSVIIRLLESDNSKQFKIEDTTITIFSKLINEESSNGSGNIKLIDFSFDLAK